MKAEILSVYGDDLMVVNTARVSMGKWHTEFDDVADRRLINYLARENHFTPFCHPKATFRLHLPIFVARQWERHRVGAVRGYDMYDQNEVSRRYVDDEPGFFHPTEWRSRPDGNIKQGSGEALNDIGQDLCHEILTWAHKQTLACYKDLLDIGVAPEQARMVLPQSMHTQWIETGSLAYWARLCGLRIDAHAQREIYDLATQVAEQMASAFPVSWAALMEAHHV